jgi:trans-aconitate 2-methyltransferase
VTPARDWDAGTYQRVSGPQLAWGLDVLERLELRGDERVLDAGCGTGRVTLALQERLPRGEVVAVDGSPSMCETAREQLGPGAEVICADLLELAVDEPVDAVFSTATFHWILDHDRLFARLHAALRPGGVLVAQCGGAGNIARFNVAAEAVAARAPYSEHLDGWERPWRFAGAEETEEKLRAAGFADARCWLTDAPVTPPEPGEFIRTVCCGPHLDRLPPELRDGYLAAVLEELDDPPVLDYVRLNIEARRDR